jgi:hypothetical protein
MRVIVVLMLLAGVARADEVMYWCDGAKNVKIALTRDGTCGSFEASDASGKKVQSASFDFTASGHLYASADGRTVLYLAGSPEPVDKTPGIVVFRDGKVAARYLAKDLLVRDELVTHSTSHIQWTVHAPASDTLGKTFELTTSSWRAISIDTETGKLTADDAPEWKKCDAIVYAGRRMHVKGDVGTIDEPAVAKGSVKGPVSFRIAKGVQLADDTSGVTVCLVGSAKGWTAVGKLDVMYNALPTR